MEASGVFLVGLAVGGDEVLDGDMAGGVYLQGEGEGAFRGVAVDGDTHGQVGAVCHFVVEAAVLEVIDVKAEATHHFLHEVFGLEVVDLVLKVGVGLEEAHVGEFVGAYGVAFGFVLDQNLGAAAVDVGGAQQMNIRYADTQHDGEDDPWPVAQGHEDDVKNGYRAGGGGLGAACAAWSGGCFDYFSHNISMPGAQWKRPKADFNKQIINMEADKIRFFSNKALSH